MVDVAPFAEAKEPFLRRLYQVTKRLTHGVPLPVMPGEGPASTTFLMAAPKPRGSLAKTGRDTSAAQWVNLFITWYYSRWRTACPATIPSADCSGCSIRPGSTLPF